MFFPHGQGWSWFSFEHLAGWHEDWCQELLGFLRQGVEATESRSLEVWGPASATPQALMLYCVLAQLQSVLPLEARFREDRITAARQWSGRPPVATPSGGPALQPAVVTARWRALLGPRVSLWRRARSVAVRQGLAAVGHGEAQRQIVLVASPFEEAWCQAVVAQSLCRGDALILEGSPRHTVGSAAWLRPTAILCAPDQLPQLRQRLMPAGKRRRSSRLRWLLVLPEPLSPAADVASATRGSVSQEEELWGDVEVSLRRLPLLDALGGG